MEKFAIEAERIAKDFAATRESFTATDQGKFDALVFKALEVEPGGSYDAGYDDGRDDCDECPECEECEECGDNA